MILSRRLQRKCFYHEDVGKRSSETSVIANLQEVTSQKAGFFLVTVVNMSNPKMLLLITVILEARGSAVGSGPMVQAGGSGYRRPNTSSSTVVSKSTRPLTEMSTRNVAAGKGGRNLTAAETIVYRMWEPPCLRALTGLIFLCWNNPSDNLNYRTTSTILQPVLPFWALRISPVSD
jgi:hypothetical protein